MRKIIVLAIYLAISNVILADQLGVFSYSKPVGREYHRGRITVKAGQVEHVYSINGGSDITEHYRCNPNVPSDNVIAVLYGIHSSINTFYKLSRISYAAGESASKTYLQYALTECENASSYYRKGGCEDRAKGFANMLSDLRYADYLEMKELVETVQSVLSRYSYLNTTFTCGYLY